MKHINLPILIFATDFEVRMRLSLSELLKYACRMDWISQSQKSIGKCTTSESGKPFISQGKHFLEHYRVTKRQRFLWKLWMCVHVYWRHLVNKKSERWWDDHILHYLLLSSSLQLTSAQATSPCLNLLISTLCSRTRMICQVSLSFKVWSVYQVFR